MEYKGFTITLDVLSDGDTAVFIRKHGLIVHTTSYFYSAAFAINCALRWIDKLKWNQIK